MEKRNKEKCKNRGNFEVGDKKGLKIISRLIKEDIRNLFIDLVKEN